MCFLLFVYDRAICSFTMAYFLPSFFQKRLLKYALSRVGLVDTEALDPDNLGIRWGQRSTVELRDIGLKLEVSASAGLHRLRDGANCWVSVMWCILTLGLTSYRNLRASFTCLRRTSSSVPRSNSCGLPSLPISIAPVLSAKQVGYMCIFDCRPVNLPPVNMAEQNPSHLMHGED